MLKSARSCASYTNARVFMEPRLTVLNFPYEGLPLPNYFANLILSESQLLSGTPPCGADQVARFLKPCGGVALASRNVSKVNLRKRLMLVNGAV